MSPEMWVLLAAAAGTEGTGAEGAGEPAGGPPGPELDWERLLELAQWHRLVPLLHAHAATGALGDIPSAFRERLQGEAAAVSRNNLLLAGELVRIARLFAGEAIPFLPFKGPVLAQQLYGNLAHRSFSDLDLLVSPSHALRAAALLKGLGYISRPPLTPPQERAYLRYEYDRSFEHPANGAHVELHWRFFNRGIAFAIDREDLWHRLQSVTFAGEEMPALPPEELLLLLTVHGAKHHWTLLLWIADVARLTRRLPVDWERAEGLARQTGTVRSLRLGLRLADELLGAAIPESLRTGIYADAAVASLAADVRRVLFERPLEPVSQREEGAFYLRTRERLADRLRYLWFWLATPNYRDQIFLPLPEALHPLHYLVRPVRMGRDLVRRLVGN